MNANTTLYAVYADAAPATVPVAGFTSITRTDDGERISFQAIASDDTAGIVYSTTATGDSLKIGGANVTNAEAKKLTAEPNTLPQSIMDNNKCWMLQITPASGSTVYHARAYVTVGGTTTYGDEKTVKLSDLESGVSMVTNLGDIDLSSNTFRTVTFDPNGGVGETLTQAVIKNKARALRTNTFTREGYVFSGWSTNQNGGGTTYTDGQNVTLNESIILYAQWRANSSGTVDYVDSGSSSTPAAQTITAPVTGDTGTVSVTATVKGNDVTIAPLTAAQVDSIVGSSNQNSTVEIDVSNLGTDADSVTIPAETVKAIEAAVSDKTKDADSLTVKLTEGSVTFDADAVKAIAAETKGDGLKVNLDDIGTEKLNTAQKSAVSDLAVETVLDAYVTSGSSRISDFKGGNATVSVKHTLKAAQSPAGIVVWYIADDGTRTQIPASFRGGEVVFTVTHFSNYVIAYDAEKAAAAGKLGKFTDLDSGAWYADGVLWALDNGVMNGVGNNVFAPNGDTSRAMIVTMLWRLEGSPVANYAMNYADVAENAWYADAIRWAASAKIASGYRDANGRGQVFNPDAAVTREQLATMLYNYAKYKGVDVSAGESANIRGYGDVSSVSGYALPAVKWAYGAGIMTGYVEKGQHILGPQRASSRAVVATMLMRYSTAK